MSMNTKRKQKPAGQRTTRRSTLLSAQTKLPFIEHAYELRRRLYFIGISVAVWAAAAYGVQQPIVAILLRPAKGESFIYTSPGGGIDFLFRICIYTGIIFSLPVIVYNCLRFIEPLIGGASWRFIAWGSVASGVLAVAGMLFGYFFGLPAALHFLTHQFTTVQIKPLVTIQSYLGFVVVYMVGSALIFQLPLVLLFINRIKPLKPQRLLHYERWIILAAFVLAGLMNPTPNIISQLLIAGPFIIVYQLGILLIAFLNRSRKVNILYQHDLEMQASRSARVPSLQPVTAKLATAQAIRPVPASTVSTSAHIVAKYQLKPHPQPMPVARTPARPTSTPAAPAARPLTREQIHALRGRRPGTEVWRPVRRVFPDIPSSLDSSLEQSL